jgi:large subunit ribosomal protein L24
VARKYGKLHVKKNDKVKVLCGKDRGKVGKVLEVYKAKGRVLVEQVNLVKRHQRPTQQLQKGGIIEKEAPVVASNVQLVCSACSRATETRWVRIAEGKRVRVCTKCHEQIDKS